MKVWWRYFTRQLSPVSRHPGARTARPRVEALEARDLPSGLVGLPHRAHARPAAAPVHHVRHATKTGSASPVSTGEHSFIDPTVVVSGAKNVKLGTEAYVGPFAVLVGANGPITIGSKSDVQDN